MTLTTPTVRLVLYHFVMCIWTTTLVLIIYEGRSVKTNQFRKKDTAQLQYTPDNTQKSRIRCGGGPVAIYFIYILLSIFIYSIRILCDFIVHFLVEQGENILIHGHTMLLLFHFSDFGHSIHSLISIKYQKLSR